MLGEDPKDDYRSTLEAQGWYRDENGNLTHAIVPILLKWWRSLPESIRAQYS